jgi:hypothetical protein
VRKSRTPGSVRGYPVTGIPTATILGGSCERFVHGVTCTAAIELMARLVASSDCSDDDKEVAISWLSELTSDLVTRLNEYGGKAG